jgi:hypothetical protein
MLSFLPQNNNILTFSDKPVQLVDYEIKGSIVNFTLLLNFYIDPIKLVESGVSTSRISLTRGLHSRPSVFKNIDNPYRDINSNIRNRVSNVKYEEQNYINTKIISSSEINLLSLISDDILNEIDLYLSGLSTLKNVYELMPNTQFASTVPKNKIKSTNSYIDPTPYVTENFAIELLQNKGITKLSKNSDFVSVNELIATLSGINSPISNIGKIQYPINGVILDYADPFALDLNINDDLGNLATVTSNDKFNETINQLYSYYVSIKNRNSFEEFLISRSATWSKIPITARVDFSTSKSLGGTVNLVMNLVNSFGGSRNKITKNIQFNRLVSDYKKIRIPPSISVSLQNDFANINIRQLDKNSSGCKIFVRDSAGISYIEVGTYKISYNNEINYTDTTYYNDGTIPSRVYRAQLLDDKGKLTPIFSDFNLVYKNSPSTLIIDTPEYSNNNNRNYMSLRESGNSGNNGKRIIDGFVSIANSRKFISPVYTVSKIQISQNNTNVGELIPVLVGPTGGVLNEEVYKPIFTFNDICDPGIWRYIVNVFDVNYEGSILQKEIVVNDIISYDPNVFYIDNSKLEYQTSAELTDNEVIVKTTITNLSSDDIYLNKNKVSVIFDYYNEGKDSQFDVSGLNSYEEIGDNQILIMTNISFKSLITGVINSGTDVIFKTLNDMQAFLNSTTVTHSLDVRLG